MVVFIPSKETYAAGRTYADAIATKNSMQLPVHPATEPYLQQVTNAGGTGDATVTTRVTGQLDTETRTQEELGAIVHNSAGTPRQNANTVKGKHFAEGSKSSGWSWWWSKNNNCKCKRPEDTGTLFVASNSGLRTS